ncbi:MAG TPA: OmpA family protein, partial [Dissulfurispiraceae bacterium]|nr:OmpA family protein [Dissulfurispiraceae bacterium]
MNRIGSFQGCIAAVLVCLCLAGISSADVRGKIIDRSTTEYESMPPSSERELQGVAELSGLSASEVKAFREAVKTAPSGEPQVNAVMKDEAQAALFQSGSAELTSEAGKRLAALAAELKGKKNVRIAIVGHTDSERISARLKPTYASNQLLSEARAMSVAAAFKKALAAESPVISAEGRGESVPVASNATPDGMVKNRRVEIRIWFDDIKAPAMVEKKEMQATPICGLADAKIPDVPFRISIDGKPVDATDIRLEADRQRCVDVALEKADIRIHYDPLSARPALNIWTTPNGVLRTAPIAFYTYTNYALWIQKAEVRIFEKGRNSQQQPYAVIPAMPNGQVVWNAPEDAPEKLYFLLRVYDEKGRFDETA